RRRPSEPSTGLGATGVSMADTRPCRVARKPRSDPFGRAPPVPCSVMPARKTAPRDQRTPLDGDYDVLICGASFAGLAVARELGGATRPDGSPARVLMIDRYEIGERQTSACGIPTSWLEALDLMGAHRQTFDELKVTTPYGE